MSAAESIENKNFRRLMLKRSYSEPGYLESCQENTTSRTDPEWNISIDSISLKSSFIDYHIRRKNRLKLQEHHSRIEDLSNSSEGEEEKDLIEEHEEMIGKIEVPSSLDLSTSSSSEESKSSHPSMAREISYEDDIRLFVENSALHANQNIFADPFESDERMSRTEQWVESVENNLENRDVVDEGEAEEIDSGNDGKKTEIKEIEDQNEVLDEDRKEDEKEGGQVDEINDGKKNKLQHQSTEESQLSSSISVNSFKLSSYSKHFQAALETQSEIDINDVERFWDVIYTVDVDKKQDEKPDDAILYDLISTTPRTSEIIQNPVDVSSDSETKNSQMEEQDREIDEISSEVDLKFFTLVKIEDDESDGHMSRKEEKPTSSQPNRYRSVSSQTTFHSIDFKVTETKHYQNSKKPNGENGQLYNFCMDQLAEKLSNDLKILIVERDRAEHAMNILPARGSRSLSDETNYHQMRYRIKIENNKERLDKRIDEIWRKLSKLPIKNYDEIYRFINVSQSRNLTLNVRRNIPDMIQRPEMEYN